MDGFIEPLFGGVIEALFRPIAHDRAPRFRERLLAIVKPVQSRASALRPVVN